ncbi:MAG: LD-carboxypeptidase [Bacteroidales bacterium]|nr:LD-carboxypeptidase [Bacteroidales bacterium]
MITPPLLKQGDTIGIISAAGKVEEDKIHPAIALFKSWGLKVVLGKHVFGSYHQFSGSDLDRMEDLQKMLDDPEIKAIFSSRGGYGTIRIIDMLNFQEFKRNPKWIVGFSDITVLHSYLNRVLEVESLHAAMPSTFPAEGMESETISSLKQALFEGSISYDCAGYSLNRAGKVKSSLVGGNLSILCSLSGTPMDIDTRGKVLFIEDVGEYLYRLDRMMRTLKAAGKLKYLAGLIIGGMTDMEDNDIPFGSSAYEIIFELVKDYDYPLAFNFLAGHMEPNRTLILGREIYFEVSDNSAYIKF